MLLSSLVIEIYQSNLKSTDTEFEGDGNLREGSGEGTWRRFSVGGDDDGGDKEVVIVSQKAMAKSEENKLTVSSSIDPQNVNLEILTFEGEYGDKKEAITDPGEYECEYDIALSGTIDLGQIF